MSHITDHCSICLTDLIDGIDCDPNGQMKANCIRCEIEQEIDFDESPNTRVSRTGQVTNGWS